MTHPVNIQQSLIIPKYVNFNLGVTCLMSKLWHKHFVLCSTNFKGHKLTEMYFQSRRNLPEYQYLICVEQFMYPSFPICPTWLASNNGNIPPTCRQLWNEFLRFISSSTFPFHAVPEELAFVVCSLILSNPVKTLCPLQKKIIAGN